MKTTTYIILFLTFLFCQTSVRAQEIESLRINMKEYLVQPNLSIELNNIIKKLKKIDSHLIFFIFIKEENYGYSIFISTGYEFIPSLTYKGYFILNNKVFLILNNAPPTFFRCSVERNIEFKVDLDNLKRIVPKYIEELPEWNFRFENNKFINIYSTY